MKIHVFSLRLLLLALISTPSFLTSAAQREAEVTFYSGGKYIETGIPGIKHGYFDGAIFDGQQRVAAIRHGRFFTMHFPPGHQVFSASLSGKHPATYSQLELDLVENGQYFIRAVSESRGVVIVDFPKGILDSVSCQIAQQETLNMRPLEEKHIAQDLISKLSAPTSAPACK
jgi:hypothetical protein